MKKYLSLLVLNYFRFFAKIQLQKNPEAKIIGITGSSGKSSTRLALASILSQRGRLKQTLRANSESGIPLDILGLHPTNYSFLDWLKLIVLAPLMLIFNQEKFDYYIVEMGIDSADPPKNMGYLLSIIRPHIAIVLNAGLTHAAGFDHLVKDQNPLRRVAKLKQVIAKEKMQLAKGVSQTGVAIINTDQKELALQLRDVSARKITFGKTSQANVRIVNTQVDKTGFRLEISYQGMLYSLRLGDILPPHYAYTFAAALAAAAALGIPPSISLPSLKTYRAPAGRMRVFQGINNSTILDSSYNASPATMQESLALLKKIGGRSKKIAVLGDMRELGASTKSAHKQLADWIVESCDEVILFGELTLEHTAPVLHAQKFPTHHFTQMNKLSTYLRANIKDHACILVKGSQNTILLERAVKAILANQSDEKDLCRRGKYWDRIRSTTK